MSLLATFVGFFDGDDVRVCAGPLAHLKIVSTILPRSERRLDPV